MKKLYLCLSCFAFILLSSSLSTAQVQNVIVDGETLVFDATNLIYWYPDMNDMIHMNKDGQQAFIYDLNNGKFANQSDWHMANLDQVINLCFSLSQDAVPTGFGPPGAESFSPVKPLQFFEATMYYGAPTPTSPFVITGRTVDEWATREDLDGSVDTRWGEGEYHLPYIPFLPIPPTGFVDVVVFDYDLNWVSDDYNAPDGTQVAPVPLGYPGVDPEQSWFECSAWVIVEAVTIDIKPFSPNNPINMRSKGKVPVAILTTSVADGDLIDFDATQLDTNGIKFGPAKASIAHENGHIEDVDSDGDLDLVLHFNTRETGIHPEDKQASIFIDMDGHTLVFTDKVKPIGYPKTNGKKKAAAVDLRALNFNVDVYPNPFSHETNIRFQLPETGHVMLKVYNTMGQEIQILANTPYDAGTHTLQWDGTDMSGNEVPGGIYIYRIQVGDKVLSDRIQLIR